MNLNFRNVKDDCSEYGGEVVGQLCLVQRTATKLCYNVTIIGLTVQRRVVGLKVVPD